MNIEVIRKGLANYDTIKVGVYVNYLTQLSTEKNKQQQPKNPWVQYQKEQNFIDIYKKVAIDGLVIDGDSITLGFKGKLMATYDYQAYKNKVLSIYPKAVFDFQLVYKGDKFQFRKESGKITYTHELADPFSNERELVGAYGIIKLPTGEFIETLNTTEIAKIKATAKTTYIWDKWFDRMVLKSIIKRICKVALKDQFKNIEAIDNENYDLTPAIEKDEEDDMALKDSIAAAKTEADLGAIYEANKDLVINEKTFIELLGARKLEIKAGK